MINWLSDAPLGSPTVAGTFPTDCGSCRTGTWGGSALDPLTVEQQRS